VKFLDRPPQVGDLLELIPSIDGLPLRFVVTKVNKELDLVRVVPLSEFVLLGGPKDVPVKASFVWGEEEVIAETDLWLEFPFSNFLRAFSDKYWVLIGWLDEKELEKVKHGIGRKYLTPEKRKFKDSEAQRMAELFKEHVRTVEELQEFTQKVLSLLEEQPALAASAEEEKAFITDDGALFVEYEPEKQLLTLKPLKDELKSRKVKLYFNDKLLFEGVIWPQITLPLPRERYDAGALKSSLRVEVA